MAEAPAKDVIGSGKAVVGAGTFAEGGAPTPQKPFEFPKIVYPVLLPSNTTIVAGGVSSSPTCGIEELLRQADILRGNSISFGKLLAESATNLKIIALVSFYFTFCILYDYPTVAPEDVDGKPLVLHLYALRVTKSEKTLTVAPKHLDGMNYSD